MDYAALIAPLAYLAAVHLSTKFNLRPISCSVLAVGLPFTVDRFLIWLSVAGHDMPIFVNVFAVDDLISVIVQLVTAWFVFKQLQLSGDYTSWLIWAIGGGLVVVYVVPKLSQLLA